VYLELSDNASAAKLADEAQGLLDAGLVLDDRDRAELLVRMGHAQRSNAQFQEASRSADEALAIHARLGDGAAASWPATEIKLGMLQLQDKSHWKKPLLDALHAIEADPESDPMLIANVRHIVGHSMTFIGEYR